MASTWRYVGSEKGAWAGPGGGQFGRRGLVYRADRFSREVQSVCGVGRRGAETGD